MPDHDTHPTTVDVALKGGETIALGDVRIQALAAPGHTPGSMCYLMERDKLRALFAGDVIMMLRGDEHPRTELGKPLGTYSAYLSPRYRGNAKDLPRVARAACAQMPVPDLVLPGHPRADVTPAKPMSHAGALAIVARRRASVTWRRVLARYEADGADFLGWDSQAAPAGAVLPGRLSRFGRLRVLRVVEVFRGGRAGRPWLGRVLERAPQAAGPRAGRPDRRLAHVLRRRPRRPGSRSWSRNGTAQVVASTEGFESLKEVLSAGTTLIPAEELPGKGWFPVDVDSAAGARVCAGGL